MSWDEVQEEEFQTLLRRRNTAIEVAKEGVRDFLYKRVAYTTQDVHVIANDLIDGADVLIPLLLEAKNLPK